MSSAVFKAEEKIQVFNAPVVLSAAPRSPHWAEAQEDAGSVYPHQREYLGDYEADFNSSNGNTGNMDRNRLFLRNTTLSRSVK